jgi:CARDB/Bacterial Ig domain
VNRPPVAAISSPIAKAEFMLGADIAFDGSASSDPDGDALTLTWSDAGKPLGTGMSVTAKLAKGKHTITLTVDDGRKGTATAQVDIYVRYIDFKGTIALDLLSPVEGQKLAVKATLTNRGDGSIDELPVSFSVDGTEVATTTIETIEPDAEFPLEFQWKAVKGDHRLDVTVNDQTFTKTVTVGKKATVAEGGGGDMTMALIAVAVIAIVAVAVGAVFVMSRRKRAAAGQYDSEYPDQRMEEPYEPIQEAPAPAPRPGPRSMPPAAMAPPAGHAPPAMTEEQQAREAIDNMEKVLADAEAAGLDTSKSRQSLKIARNFMEMGKYPKVMVYCQNAENSLE